MARVKKEETGEKKEKSLLDQLKEDLEKKTKGVHISILSKSEIATINTYIDTPTYDLNRIISGSIFRGVPEKSFVLLAGPEASFKSSFMAIAAGKAQKEGFTPLIIDTEGSWTQEFCERWGMNRDNALYVYTPWVDQILVMLGQIIKNESYKKLFVILDSIGGLERLKLISDSDKGDVKADQGTLQKDIKRMLKMLVNIAKAKSSIVFAGGHFYGNPSGYGDPEQLGGGFYLRLASDIIVVLKKYLIKDDDKNIVKVGFSAVTRKNRFYPPFNEATVEIDWQKGINAYAGLMDIALEAKLLTGGGAGWYTIPRENGEDIKFQGGWKFNEYIDETLLKDIEEYIKTTGYSSINENVAEAEKLIEESEDYKKEKAEWQSEE